MDVMPTPIGSQQDSTTIIVPTPIGEMAIAEVYSPPGDNNLKDNLESIIQKAPNYIIGRDLNSKCPAWSCKQFNKWQVAGKDARRILTDTITDMKVKQELSSDHVPIIATLTLTNSRQPYHKPLLQTDREKLKNSIKNDYQEFKNHEITDIDMEAKTIIDTIKHHIKKEATRNHSTVASGNKNQEI
ncbi:hypothetical protein PR048_015701 [Dryococelus australis]|uniref:Endonuclease/exonuclease/phosphatase domain-containing protein n=1 Tax=Dryococelus australis TaxID=614101 RepID=A0ABQ9HHN5_9NEOP|nr:hypothetical protein PR048_015701 [Dryococelus australis]